jgi:glycosyltransferase involved in cell wall biosynthesis
MKISVCLAAYNGALYIREQIDSILIQLTPLDELIVSDNCSTDETIDIVKSFNDPRIKIHTEKRQGIISNFQNALLRATGDVIFLADQDDIWLEHKVSTVLSSLNQCDLVLHDALVVDSTSKLLSNSLFAITKPKSGLFMNLMKSSYVGCCMAFKKDLLKYALPLPMSIGMHDWWIALVGEAYFKTTHLKDQLIKYRRHEANFSSTTGGSNYPLSKRMYWRLALVWNLLLLCKKIKSNSAS